MKVDIHKILKELAWVHSIEVLYSKATGRFSYFFKVYGILTPNQMDYIISFAERQGLKFDGISRGHEALRLIFCDKWRD